MFKRKHNTCTERVYSSVVEQSTADRQVHGSTPCAPFIFFLRSHNFSFFHFKHEMKHIEYVLEKLTKNLSLKLSSMALLSYSYLLQIRSIHTALLSFRIFLDYQSFRLVSANMNVVFSMQGTNTNFGCMQGRNRESSEVAVFISCLFKTIFFLHLGSFHG